MAEIKIVKTKLRRGTNNQRKAVVLDQGEIVYTTDTQRLYVGNGVLSGGVSPSAKIHPILTNTFSLTSLNAETNDIAIANNTFYQLTGSNPSLLGSWANINTKVNLQLEYSPTGTLSIRLSGLSASNFDPNTVGNGIKVQSGILQSNYITKSLDVSANKLTVKQGGIDEWEISSSTFANGISGGSGNKVGIRINPSDFCFVSGVLSLSSIPSGSLTFTSLDSSWIGDGLIYDGVNSKIKSVLTNVDNVTLTKDLSGVVSITPGIVPQTIFDILTGNSSTNATNSLSSIFNGNPQHTINGAIPGLQITKFTAISTNGVTTQTIELSSAGFIAYQGNNTTTTGQPVGRFAIPIFAY